MRFLRQSTAAEVAIGPFLDSTDGVTPETALTIDITAGDLFLKRHEADWADKSEATVPAHESKGWYRCLLNTTDSATLGHLMLACTTAGALPVWHEFEVITKVAWDVKFGAFFAGDELPSQTGMTSTQIKLPAGASTEDDYYNGLVAVRVIGGDGKMQERIITDYVGATKVATVQFAWAIQPTGTADGGVPSKVLLVPIVG